jgi:hypothetical protein
MYLRDTSVIQQQHIDALQSASQEVLDSISALPEDVIALSMMTNGMADSNTSENADEMDWIKFYKAKSISNETD